MFRMAMLAATLVLAISALVIPAAQGKPLTPATLPGEHGQIVTQSTSTTQMQSAENNLLYGLGNSAARSYEWTRRLAPDDRGFEQGIGNSATAGTRPDDRGVAQGIGEVTTAPASSGSSYDWTTLIAAFGLGFALVVLVAGGVATSQRRQGEKLAA